LGNEAKAEAEDEEDEDEDEADEEDAAVPAGLLAAEAVGAVADFFCASTTAGIDDNMRGILPAGVGAVGDADKEAPLARENPAPG